MRYPLTRALLSLPLADSPKSKLESVWNSKEVFNIQEVTRQLHTVSSILAYPAEYGYTPLYEISAITTEECSNTLPSSEMQEDEPEEVGAIRTYFGPNPPRKGYNKTYRPYDQKYTPTDFQTKQRAETLWRQRMNVPRPQLGSIDPVNNTIPVQTVPVNDKGIMLSCDSLLTAAAEIDEWERSIDLAVGRTFSAWEDVRKLAYIEATMTGRAQLLWNNFKATEYYRS